MLTPNGKQKSGIFMRRGHSIVEGIERHNRLEGLEGHNNSAVLGLNQYKYKKSMFKTINERQSSILGLPAGTISPGPGHEVLHNNTMSERDFSNNHFG